MNKRDIKVIAGWVVGVSLFAYLMQSAWIFVFLMFCFYAFTMSGE